ncbi:hypothetical protein [Streptomyces palmae]|uniref:Uncharacterized protein n=1 Tax=Streptomyces palmae TaxID=1701085 RepID=A0A4Z0GRU6_9ACTN|nr:hypothetical protein [Streptomyces palmae]TGA99357.1 hypothetical protein E4099_22480 [Streptomyces palmae]
MNTTGSQIYRAEVLAEGPVDGHMKRVCLGRHQTPSAADALHWLRVQAVRVADGLDLDPRTPWLAGRSLRTVPDALADVPTEFRQWCADPDRQLWALRQLEEGVPVVVAATDHTGRYSLTAWPAASHVARPSSRRHLHRKRRPLAALVARLAG